MMASKDPYIIYYTNDYEKYVDEEMELFKENGVEAFENGRWDRQSAVDIIIEKLKYHELLGTPLKGESDWGKEFPFLKKSQTPLKDESNLEKLKSLINVKGRLENYTDDEMDDIILAAMKNKDLEETIIEAYEEYLRDDPWLIPDLIENGEEMANEFLEANNWFKEPWYLILGYDLDWRHHNGYKIVKITNETELEDAITPNCDYTITLQQNKKNDPYLYATVSSHDVPMGSSFYLIPVNRLEEVKKADDFKEIPESVWADYEETIKEYMEDAE